MKMITVECPKCKGSLQVDAKNDKIFCMYCRAEITVKSEFSGGATENSLLKRGMILVEHKDFQKALDIFERAAEINPENSLIYLGMLMAEIGVSVEQRLGEHHKALTNYSSYKKALRFANPTLKQKLENYNRSANQRHQRNLAKKREKDKQRLDNEGKIREEKKVREAEELLRAKKRKRRRGVIFLLITAIVIAFFFVNTHLTARVFQEWMYISNLAEIFEESPRNSELNDRLRLFRPDLSDARNRPFEIHWSAAIPRGAGGTGDIPFGSRLQLYYLRTSQLLDLVVITQVNHFDGRNLNRGSIEEVAAYFEEKYDVEVTFRRHNNLQFLYFILEDKDLEIRLRYSSNPNNPGNNWQIQIRRFGTDFWF